MLTKEMLEILRRASLGQLPRSIDQHTPGVNLQAFKELRCDGLVDAIDASADGEDAYLEPTITLRGREMLERKARAARPWWTSFDRRATVTSLVVAVLSLAAGLGLLRVY